MAVDKENIAELIRRMEIRKKLVWKYPNPQMKPAWEKTEIQNCIDKLKKLIE